MSPSFAFDPINGGRLSSLNIRGLETIYNNSNEPATSWGAYPMLPYAGRVHEGRFEFEGSEYQLEINQDEHAMHGVAFTSPWRSAAPDHIELEFDERWPLGGTASQTAVISGDDTNGRLTLEITVTATHSAMPVMIGWHPWFNRQLRPDGPPALLELGNFDAVEMYEIGENMIPTGATISPPNPGPWDHPFRSVEQPIGLTWGSDLRLSLRSTCDHWVIYDRPDHALCVEPQSGPPDIFNSDRFDLDPTVLQPGDNLTHTFTIDWETS